MPEPDHSVVRGAIDEDETRQTLAIDVAFLVEVSDSSLINDSRDKLEAYAADRIPSCWIVNIPDRRFEVDNDPTGAADGKATDRTREDYGPTDEVPVVLGGREVGRVAARDVLPRTAGMDPR